MSGYFFFTITALCGIGLFLLTSSKPSMAGDNAMGYGLGLAFLGAGFAFSSFALTITILTKEGFRWVANDAGIRTATVLLAWLGIAAATFFCAVFKVEWNSDDDNTYPSFLHTLALWQGQVWIPLLWLVACFLSLRAPGPGSLSPVVRNVTFFAGLIVSVVYTGGLLLGYLRDSARQAELERASRQTQEDRFRQETLAFLASQRPDDPILPLLVHTNRFQTEEVRQAALAKIKAHADWENELLALLKDQRTYREVYYFLDGNPVPHPDRFTTPLNESIDWLSASIEADIKNSNNLQSWSFDSYGIDRLLRTIDAQFGHQGVDFYPQVLRLKQALHTTPPERFKGVAFDAADGVEAWLRSHKK
ncbi:hypothetical protein ACFPMF_24550 [Larkinella bovis]|uniref:MFS transporter n=1 Tax=Larkinella bovis TaxID=683041 RepID=A0ABW0IJ21_9BACT